MKKWMDLLCVLLLAGMAAAQSNMSLPAGTAMRVKLETTLATFSNKSGDPFQGRITQPVTLNGKTLIPVGATVLGHVTKLSEPRRIAGKPTIGIFPETVVLANGEPSDAGVREARELMEHFEIKPNQLIDDAYVDLLARRGI